MLSTPDHDITDREVTLALDSAFATPDAGSLEAVVGPVVGVLARAPAIILDGRADALRRFVAGSTVLDEVDDYAGTRVMRPIRRTTAVAIVQTLAPLQRSGSPEVRMRVAVFLRFLPADVVVKALSGFFDDPAESVRKAAAQSAGSLAVDELVDGLVGLLADPSKAVRTAAAAALVATVTPAMRSRVVAQVVARLDDDGVLPADFTALWGMLGVASRA